VGSEDAIEYSMDLPTGRSGRLMNSKARDFLAFV
jgi:hypothetical protein